ncbi:hypothetical protein LXL04_019972 [Taraxacum kok-saghyz]
MDTKSLAKSKRAHSQHHKKHHPNPKATTTTTTTTTTTKAPGNTVEVKQLPRQSHGSSALPSNWDRYEDEDDPIIESQTDGQQQNDVVLPKSKGADYAYLISEAKSQNSTRLSSDIFPSLDDFVSDFGQGKDSFVAVRGESLLSSVLNDGFFVDDKSKTPASYEASFLSLNLHDLSEQLAKIDLPKRLFMEKDLFPPKMYSERQKESETSSYGHNYTNRNQFKPSNHQEPITPSNPTTSHDHIICTATNPNPTVAFEPKRAELELDMLLDSFEDSNLKENDSKTKKEKQSVAFDIDETLDDLLKDTVGVVSSSSERSVSKSELLDDFDSWLDTI